MSIEGRISIDALFHDKEGTASLKVVSLQDSRAYTSGKVAIVSGTCGTTAVSFTTSDSGQPSSDYRDASGQLVSFNSIDKVVLKPTNVARPLVFVDATESTSITIRNGEVLVYPCLVTPDDSVSVRSLFSGTASYTIVMYGT